MSLSFKILYTALKKPNQFLIFKLSDKICNININVIKDLLYNKEINFSSPNLLLIIRLLIILNLNRCDLFSI